MKRRTLIATGLALPFLAPARAKEASALADAITPLQQLHSLQVQIGPDVLIAEAPHGLDRAANIKSCSKSIVALLLGDALRQGSVPAVTARLGDVAPRLIPAGADARAADITLEDLVTLRAGLERTSGPNYGEWVSSSNWVANALGREFVAEPGGRMLYSTGSFHILGAALAEATGESLLAQARRALGEPLGIEIPAWTRDPQGYFLGGNEMALTPRAMLKIAVMMRDGGMFGDTQVVAEEWVNRSTTSRTRSPFSGMDYGYGWFLTRSGYALARGYGGQVIAFHPGRDLAVAITSDPTLPARSGGYFGDLARLLDGPILALA